MAGIKPNIKPEIHDVLNLEHEQRDGGSNASIDDGGLFDRRVMRKLSTKAGNTVGLPAKVSGETKFSSRCRLYIGNLHNTTEEEVTKILKNYGDVADVFVNEQKMFALARLDYRHNAERARRDLDRVMCKSRPLKVRFSPVVAAIKVKNLSPSVTNELLEYSFSIFGNVERAQVVVDEHGKSVLEGIVEFTRKPMARSAITYCTERCFYITKYSCHLMKQFDPFLLCLRLYPFFPSNCSCSRPVIAEPYHIINDIDGFGEKSIKKDSKYLEARETGPRFAVPNSFEFEYGARWKEMFDFFKEREESLKRTLKLEEGKLMAQIEYDRYEHEIDQLRGRRLGMLEQERESRRRELELKERQANDGIKLEEEHIDKLKRQVKLRMWYQENDLWRRQHNNDMFFKNRLANKRDRSGSNFEGNSAPPQMDVMNADDHFDERNDGPPGLRGNRYDVPVPEDDVSSQEYCTACSGSTD